jgi:hypothetical protein
MHNCEPDVDAPDPKAVPRVVVRTATTICPCGRMLCASTAKPVVQCDCGRTWRLNITITSLDDPET